MKKKKILIIDDEVDIIKLLEIRLKAYDYYVMPLYTSTRALEVTKREKPNLVLVDVSMPDKGGYDVCKEIKTDSETRDIPVILYTAQQAEKDHIKDLYKTAGADDYMLKPFDENKLLAKIKALTK